MRTLIFLLFAVAPIGHATDTIPYSCRPGRQANGLGIKSLNLDISKGNPQATMTLTYEFVARQFVTQMVYEADQREYDLSPESADDGDVSVVLIKNRRKWTATVKSATIDTISVLDCQ